MKPGLRRCCGCQVDKGSFVTVSFLCQYDGLGDARLAGKTFFLGVTVRVSVERLAFESVV